MSKLDEFQDAASLAFAFLSDQYGFTCDGPNTQAAESYLSYGRPDLVVTVNYELGDEPWVTLAFPDRGQRTSLNTLARDAGVVLEDRKGATLREQVFRNAALLRLLLETQAPSTRNAPRRA